MDIVTQKQGVTVFELASKIDYADKINISLQLALSGADNTSRVSKASSCSEEEAERLYKLRSQASAVLTNKDDATEKAKFKEALNGWIKYCDHPLQYELVD